MALPAVLAAVGVSAVEGWRFRTADSTAVRQRYVYSLAEAIESADVRRAHEFIRAGQDANRLIPVRHPVLTGGRWVWVSPLLWAVALRNEQAVVMLLGFGARLERAGDRKAPCLADQVGAPQIARLLRRHAPSAAEACEDFRAGEAPLLSLADSR